MPSRDPGRWRRFSVILVVAAAATLAGAIGGVILLDPYDTGRFTPLGPQGMAAGPPWQVNASRARDPRFDSAVFGNSRVQMLEPARLDAATGGRFVNLAIQGAAPPETELVFESFLRHHPEPRAIVIGLDEWWCRASQKRGDRFPYWLYASDAGEYLRGLVRYQTLEYVTRRLGVLRGSVAMARPDGYWDYTPLYEGMSKAEAAQQRMRAAPAPRPAASDNPENIFPAVARLKRMLDALPGGASVALVWPPTHVSHQPAAGSGADVTLRQCQAALYEIAGARPGVTIVDWGGARDFNYQAANFHDETHYRKTLAEQLADAVAAGLSPKPGG
ncbi:hypothetical protein ACERNI_16020 [Camelimonas sp. ID_303_24]